MSLPDVAEVLCNVRDTTREVRSRTGLRVAEYAVLRALAADKLSMSRLARQVGMSPSGVTRLVNRLGEYGWTQRERSESDARIVYVTLTEAGQQKLAETT